MCARARAPADSPRDRYRTEFLRIEGPLEGGNAITRSSRFLAETQADTDKTEFSRLARVMQRSRGKNPNEFRSLRVSEFEFVRSRSSFRSRVRVLSGEKIRLPGAGKIAISLARGGGEAGASKAKIRDLRIRDSRARASTGCREIRWIRRTRQRKSGGASLGLLDLSRRDGDAAVSVKVLALLLPERVIREARERKPRPR